MSLKLQIIHAKDFIKLTHEGELDLKEARKDLLAVASMEDLSRDHLIIIDIRKAKVKMSTADIWYLSAELGKHILAHQNMTAILAPKVGFDSARFFELCAQNRGFRIKAFTNFEDAIGWLMPAADLE